MSELQSQLNQIIDQFVSAVLEAMRSASLTDLADRTAATPSPARARTAASRQSARQAKVVAPRAPAPPTAKPAAVRHRASAEEVARLKALALSTGKQLPAGFSKSDVMKRAGAKVDLGRFLTLLVDEGLLTKKGERRNTRYWVK